MFLFFSGKLFFSFLINAACRFWKDVNSIIHGKTVVLLNKARVISNTGLKIMVGYRTISDQNQKLPEQTKNTSDILSDGKDLRQN